MTWNHDEDDERDDDEEVWMAETASLVQIKNSDKYDQWLYSLVRRYLEKVENGRPGKEMQCKVGQSYLQRSTMVFTKLKYDDGMMGLVGDEKEAQKISQELITKALNYLKQTKDEGSRNMG